MDFIRNLDLHIRARCAIIYIQTYEEERIQNDMIQMAERLKPQRSVETWDFLKGFPDGSGKGNPVAAIEHISKGSKEQSIIYILKDYHRFLDDVSVSRAVRNLVAQLKSERKTVVITAPLLKIPADLEEDIVILDYTLPTYQEIEDCVLKLTSGASVELTDSGREMLIKAFQGLTINKIRTILSKALARSGKITEDDIELVLEEKKQIIRRTEVLEFYPAAEGMNDVGGLYELKKWIDSRGLAFTQRAKDYGLPYPKGVLMVGIQGTGKSLCSKVISRQWKMPLLKLDVGRLMGSLVGESEGRTRQMIKTAEAMAPCVLWIDEIDKAFSGVGGYQGDSGTSARVFGTIITWMQEKKSPVFIVATANNIENLPPELLRKGRFDEIFFVDLPDAKERKEIFTVHLIKKRDNDIRRYNAETLANAAEGFSGAEIEQVIIDAMYEAFKEGREFTTEDILCSIEKTVPLSKTARETINRLKEWADGGRARRASERPVSHNGVDGVLKTIDVDMPSIKN